MKDVSNYRLYDVVLDETFSQLTPAVDHERSVAMFDLIENSVFTPAGHPGGPYRLTLSLTGGRLVLAITDQGDDPVATHHLALAPLRRIVKDYWLICESYYEAIRAAAPAQIETIDMGRRGLHNEGSQQLVERLSGKIDFDFNTARRLFTLICLLYWKGCY